MKSKGILLSLFLLLSVAIFSQTKDCPTCPPNGTVDDTEYDVIKLKDQMYEGEFVPGEILVKFKDEVTLVLAKSSKGYAVTGISAVDEIFQTYKISEAKKLFPNQKRKLYKQKFTTFNGYEFERPSLHNIHKLKVDEEAERVNINEAIERLKELPEVEYAEPNYIYSIVEDEAISPELSEEEMIEWLETNSTNSPTHPLSKSPPQNKIQTVTPNDPLYDQQWGIPATQVDAVWDSTKGDTTQVIAVLDTGVDWLHPDLKNKIWKNKDEIADNGIDDDGNGFIDDIRGWDYINHDNDPKDDNSHGTHVAGIAAAESDNGIGIAGVNWYAKILPIKVFQSSGRGDAATITEGIIYAANKGATVINMSFGSYSRSFTMENALANAYANSVLVAAAGNDNKEIGPCPPALCPVYPAAISYVLGSQATQQTMNSSTIGFKSGTYLTGFTNFDASGPVYSNDKEDLINYELVAPGATIISSIPNGNYRVFNGTSMSTPLVAGIISLYESIYPGQSQELMWGNFINTAGNHIQSFNAMNIDAKPRLWFVSSSIVDTVDGDNDERVDAGETIELWFEVRNTWGKSDSVWCGIEFGEFEDRSTATILKNEAFIGSISPYARRTNEFNPLKIKIDPSVAHDRDIVFTSKLWYTGSTDTVKQQILLTVEKGEELSGIIDTTLILTPDKLWLISESFRVGLNAKLIIKPGTNIIIYPGKPINVKGDVQAIGTKDSIITFSGQGGTVGQGVWWQAGGSDRKSTFEYCRFDNIIEPLRGGNFDAFNCTFNNMHLIYTISEFKNNVCLFYGSSSNSRFYSGTFSYNNFIDNTPLNSGAPPVFSMGNAKFNNFIKCSIGVLYNSLPDSISWFNSFINPDRTIFSAHQYSQYDYIYIKNQYVGTTNADKIEELKYDFLDNPFLPYIVISPLLESPPNSCHGIVWKVLVDGVDPQDEHLDPIGPGPHRFDVYFNRPMDTEYTPSLTFGVREPYTQQAVTDSSFWSPDSMIWTAYKTIQLHTGDGINRIRVADARDTENFEIPVEDMRFEFVIDAAGLSSTDFNAIAGLGKIELDWKTPEDVTDLLGYNLYRFTNITDTTYTDTTLINEKMILDTTYTDFAVVPGNNYYYQYSVVKTDFSESDLSKVVGTQALTSSPGDANGDLSVNVLDITSIVAYLLNENPQPFIYEAADIDANGDINVLDIVSTVNIIMNGGSGSYKLAKGETKLGVTEGRVTLENGEGIAGIEMKIIGEGIEDVEVIFGGLLDGMEYSYKYDKDTLYVLAYNFKNRPIDKNEGLLFSIKKGRIKEVKDILASDPLGNEVAIEVKKGGDLVPKEFTLFQNYPNPFNPTTTIRYGLKQREDVEIKIFNILGQLIWEYKELQKPAGYHEILWKSINGNNRKVASGVYIYQIKAGTFIDAKKMLLLK